MEHTNASEKEMHSDRKEICVSGTLEILGRHCGVTLKNSTDSRDYEVLVKYGNMKGETVSVCGDDVEEITEEAVEEARVKRHEILRNQKEKAQAKREFESVIEDLS